MENLEWKKQNAEIALLKLEAVGQRSREGVKLDRERNIKERCTCSREWPIVVGGSYNGEWIKTKGIYIILVQLDSGGH